MTVRPPIVNTVTAASTQNPGYVRDEKAGWNIGNTDVAQEGMCVSWGLLWQVLHFVCQVSFQPFHHKSLHFLAPALLSALKKEKGRAKGRVSRMIVVLSR